MSSYDFLASCYDELTTDVGYPAWADYLEAHFRRKGLPGRTVLDLACGTGSLTWELAARGYEMIGVDRSPEMLAEAAAKGREDVETPPIFLCQSIFLHQQGDGFRFLYRVQIDALKIFNERNFSQSPVIH